MNLKSEEHKWEQARRVWLDESKKTMRMLGCAVVMTIWVLPQSIFAWTEPINISNTPIHSTQGNIAIGEDGRIHVVWSEWEDSDGDHDIFYSVSEDGGESWSTPQNICDDPRVSLAPQVLVDSSNIVHIFWDDGYGSTPLLWTYQSDSGWASPVNIAEDSPGVRHFTAAVDRRNGIWMFWDEYLGQVWYTLYSSNSWTLPEKITNEEVYCGDPDAAVDSRNNIHLIWKKDGDYYTDNDIYYSKYQGVEWSAPEKVESLPGYSSYPKIRINSKGRPWVIWQERHQAYKLYYAHRDTTGWSPAVLIADEDRFSHDFIIDSTDILHLFYDLAGSSGLYCSFLNDTSWSIPSIISDTLKSCKLGDIVINKRVLSVIFSASRSTTPGEDWTDVYHIKQSLTSIAEESRQFNGKQILTRNFPNPFWLKTTIPYKLEKKSYISLTISNLAGQLIHELEIGYKDPGSHTLHIPVELLKEGGGAYMGIYFYRLMADGGIIATGKMVVVR